MAAKPPKPPGTNYHDQSVNSNLNVIESELTVSSPSVASETEDSSSNSSVQYQNKSGNHILDCSCTNISIMQLFHEMKQEFPTVPDHVVNQCVIDNCHDRENCIDLLKRELATHPNPVQSYPSHALRNNQNFMCNSKVLKPTRPAPVPKVNNNPTNNTAANKIHNNSNRNKCDTKNLKNCQESNSDVKTDIKAGGDSNNTTNLTSSHPSACDMQQTKSSDEQVNVVQPQRQPKRPTTLSFREPQKNSVGFADNNQNSRIIHKPVRRAPLPPIPKPQQSQQQQLQHSHVPHGSSDHSYSSASIQSPLSFSDSGESEISVNISLSPSSERSRGVGGGGGGVGTPITRRMTAITVQPEPAYTRDFTPQSPRSFTSLNLTLRKPSTTPQSPIDITAGPGLTYYSSSFDARRGYQKSFHITVTDQGGTFSASRIRPRTTCHLPAIYSDNEINDANLQSQFPRTSTTDSLHVDNPVYYSQQDVVSRLIQRQKNRKDALARCLHKNKQKLERVQNEIDVLTSPVPPGESERLDSEIERLRCDCQNILQEIENAKRIELPSNNIGYYDNEQLNIFGRSGVGGQQLQFPPSSHLPYDLYHQPQPSLHGLGMAPPPPLPPYQYQQQQIPPFTPNGGDVISGGSVGMLMNSQQPSSQHLRHNQDQQEQQQNNPQYDEINPDGGPPWTCSMCTFQNHPLLNKCECCDNVRIIPEPVITSREDIHIHLSPGENRVIHSWVVS